jgi:hypothetical protein
VSGDEVVGEAGDGLARVSIAAALTLLLSRASFLTGHALKDKRGWFCVRVVVRRGFRESIIETGERTSVGKKNKQNN